MLRSSKARIKLMVGVEDGNLTGRTVDQIPIVERSTINTQALISEGQSLLIGGMVRESNTSNVDKVPGLGDVRWGPFFSALTDAGYKGPVCIEVEDRAFEGSLEDRKRSGRPRRVDAAQVVATTLTPPPERLGVTHWSSRLLAAELGVGFATVARIWRDWGLPEPYIRSLMRWSPSAWKGARTRDTGEVG